MYQANSSTFSVWRNMKDFRHRSYALALLVASGSTLLRAQSIELNQKAILEVHTVITRPDDYRGRRSIEVRDAAPALGDEASRMVLIKSAPLREGSTEVMLREIPLLMRRQTFADLSGLRFVSEATG
jgi:hypothetical protein